MASNSHAVKFSGFRPKTKDCSDSIEYSIQVVCISNTHNSRPEVPYGDILVHAGDLTENGSFDELQQQLDWRGSLPHPHKVLIAGNHDILLDDTFLEAHPERRYGSDRTKSDLSWPESVIYLQDNSVVLDVCIERQEAVMRGKASGISKRKVKVYGSTFTPQYAISAFQYPRSEDTFWHKRIPADADIVVTHGPPRLYFDSYSGISRGCPYLAEEICRTRPRLHVFGHIHAGHGMKLVHFDTVQSGWTAIHNGMETGLSAWLTIAHMWLITYLWNPLYSMIRVGTNVLKGGTTLVNASTVRWDSTSKQNILRDDGIIVVEI